jgi:peptide chain release factor subunit 1
MTSDKITLIVPHRRPVEDIVSQLRNELGIAKNIKNDETRNNVIQALNTTIEYIYAFVNKIPVDGLILNAHKDKIIRKIPKKPVNINLYRCDDHFYTYMGETL